MTSVRSQSISGAALKGCRLLMLKSRFARAPPTIVKLDKATAYFAEKPTAPDYCQVMAFADTVNSDQVHWI